MLRKGDGADMRAVLILFVVGCCSAPLVFLAFAGAYPGTTETNPATLISISVSACLSLCGAYVFLALRNMADVSARRVILGLLKISLLLAVLLQLAGLATGYWMFFDLGADALQVAAGLLLMYLASFLLVLGLAFSFLFQAFGAVSLLMGALRRLVPWTISSLRTQMDSPPTVRKLVLWLFNIPYYMDPGDLRTGPSLCVYTRSALLRSIGLVFLLDLTFGVYLCLNPFFLSLLPLPQLFVIVTLLSFAVPVLAMIIESFAAVGACIPGGKRDLDLARGLRSRAIGVLVPVGTMLILLRMMLQTLHWDSLLGLLELLGIYLFFNVALGATMMYVFYHYFERQVACFPE
jgi:hypothetical protein